MSIPKLGQAANKKEVVRESGIEGIKENGETGFEEEESVCIKSYTIDDFDILEKIGKGNFGNVFLAR